jgi:putative flippase GtrA
MRPTATDRAVALGARFPLLREANLFVLVGAAATGCHVAAALAAQAALNLGPLVANLVGYVAAAGVSYLGNALVTFRRPVLSASQMRRFVVVSLTALALNQGIVFACVRGLGWPLALALVPVILVVPASSFVFAKVWAFQRPFRRDGLA